MRRLLCGLLTITAVLVLGTVSPASADEQVEQCPSGFSVGPLYNKVQYPYTLGAIEVPEGLTATVAMTVSNVTHPSTNQATVTANGETKDTERVPSAVEEFVWVLPSGNHPFVLDTPTGSSASHSFSVVCEEPEPEQKKVTICHRTRSASNPYGPKPKTLSVNAVDGEISDHLGVHDGPLFDPEVHTNGDVWGDIIPEFGDYAGSPAWQAGGDVVLANGCQYPEPEPEPEPDPDPVAPSVDTPGVKVSCDEITVTVTASGGDNGVPVELTLTTPAGSQQYELFAGNGDAILLDFDPADYYGETFRVVVEVTGEESVLVEREVPKRSECVPVTPEPSPTPEPDQPKPTPEAPKPNPAPQPTPEPEPTVPTAEPTPEPEPTIEVPDITNTGGVFAEERSNDSSGLRVLGIVATVMFFGGLVLYKTGRG